MVSSLARCRAPAVLALAGSALASLTSDVDVKVFAVYWPQWHSTPLNDYWFGINYTDWDLLCNWYTNQDGKNRIGMELLHPLQQGPDGFGWYNLTADRSVRRRQALLAKEYGIYGFAIYHYWFSRDPSWGRGASWEPNSRVGADMDESVMRLLDADDGEPNMPFYFVWANEAFIWRWTTWNTGRVSDLAKGQTHIPQTYPRQGWRPHWDYLLKFFQHKNYHKIDGKPVLAMFYTKPEIPPEMWRLFQQWAREAGFPGIFVLQWYHGKQDHKVVARSASTDATESPIGKFDVNADAVQEFGWNTGYGSHRKVPTTYHPKWNYGIIADFDNTPRKGLATSTIGKRGGPKSLAHGVKLLLNATVHDARLAKRKEAMLMIVAWNEWTEQAVLEPSQAYGIGYLEELRHVLKAHGQYRYTGKPGLWRTEYSSSDAKPPQLTRCAYNRTLMGAEPGSFSKWFG